MSLADQFPTLHRSIAVRAILLSGVVVVVAARVLVVMLPSADAACDALWGIAQRPAYAFCLHGACECLIGEVALAGTSSIGDVAATVRRHFARTHELSLGQVEGRLRECLLSRAGDFSPIPFEPAPAAQIPLPELPLHKGFYCGAEGCSYVSELFKSVADHVTSTHTDLLEVQVRDCVLQRGARRQSVRVEAAAAAPIPSMSVAQQAAAAATEAFAVFGRRLPLAISSDGGDKRMAPDDYGAALGWAPEQLNAIRRHRELVESLLPKRSSRLVVSKSAAEAASANIATDDWEPAAVDYVVRYRLLPLLWNRSRDSSVGGAIRVTVSSGGGEHQDVSDVTSRRSGGLCSSVDTFKTYEQKLNTAVTSDASLC